MWLASRVSLHDFAANVFAIVHVTNRICRIRVGDAWPLPAVLRLKHPHCSGAHGTVLSCLPRIHRKLCPSRHSQILHNVEYQQRTGGHGLFALFSIAMCEQALRPRTCARLVAHDDAVGGRASGKVAHTAQQVSIRHAGCRKENLHVPGRKRYSQRRSTI